jgi:beta-N-acetylhexosaminidase
VARHRAGRVADAVVTFTVAATLLAGCDRSSTTSSSSPPETSPSPRTSGSSAAPDSGSPGDEATTTSVPGTASTPPGSLTSWGPTAAEWSAARRAAARLSDRELAGQVIVAQYTGTAPPQELVSRYHLGGVIVMEDNVESVRQITRSNVALQRPAVSGRRWPLVVAVDQEGGIVARVGAPMTAFPSFMSQGAAADPRLARRVAAASGQELRAAGFTMVFAPVADVTVGPTDPTIGSRSAGGRPSLVADMVAAASTGYASSGIVSVLKHFPGHGSLTADSHETLPVQPVDLPGLRRRDFVPFQAAIEARAPAVMLGHISLARVDPGVPADLSRPAVDLLSSELGFEGLAVTDSLSMAAVTNSYGRRAPVAALRAGMDMLLMPADTASAYRAILDALHDGTLSRLRLRNAAAKVIALMMHQGRAATAPRRGIGSHAALSRRLSVAAATVVQGPCTGPYVGRTVTPTGDPGAVRAFSEAANRAGLGVGGGDTVALLGYGASARDADVVVSLDTPYVLADATADAKIALFGSGRPAMGALVGILTGSTDAGGRLPVAVPGVDPPRC